MRIDQDRIAAFCEQWKIVSLSVFGSVLREEFGPDSDVDVLVEFSEDAEHSLFDLVRMREELAAVLGRDVDIVARPGVEASRNRLRREEILNSAERVYGGGTGSLLNSSAGRA